MPQKEKTMSNFPTAPKRPKEITQHGQTRVDNYFWMRYREDPEVEKYLHAENDYMEEVMQHTNPLQETLFQEMKGRIKEDDNSVPELRGGYYYYTRTQAGKQYPIYCRKKGSLDAPEQILLDQNALAEGKTFIRIGAFAVSPDGAKLAYSIDPDGSENCTLYIKNLMDDSHYPEQFPNTYGSVYDHTGVEWANDSQTLFYVTLDSAQRPYKLHRHTLGADPATDALLYTETDETYYFFLGKTRSDKFLVTQSHSTTTDEWRFLDADDPFGEWKLFSPRQTGVEYRVTHQSEWFFIATNDAARNFRLMKTPISATERANWQEVIAHRADTLVEEVEGFANYLVVLERRGGLKQIRVSDPATGSLLRYVDFPEAAYNFFVAKNPEHESSHFRITYSSLITPPSVVDIDLHSGVWDVKKCDEIPSGYDASQYVTERLYAPAPDGTLVPMSVVYKKGLERNGKNPTLLYGYGSYGASMDATFNANRLSLLDRGFVYAIGHIRGGSEMGRDWYEDGKMLNKRNTFTDFIACGEHLIAEGYTSKEKLAILGGSAGGLLVGACMALRPDLFGAVVCKVPFVDVISTMSDPTIPLTTLEYDQWGNPENKEYFDYMMSYSPYDNLRAAAYPHILITTGMNDPRVAYWEPAKFTAKLRELKTDENLVLLKTDFNAGHAGASGRYDFLKEVAFDYAFLIDRLG
jgi:oligopeptidase B